MFTSMLADIRSGHCPAQTLKELQTSCCRPLETSDGIHPTQVWSDSCGPQDQALLHTAKLSLEAVQLFTHRDDVDQINEAELAKLPGQAVPFLAQDSGPSATLLQAACPVSCCQAVLPASAGGGSLTPADCR